MKRHVVEIKYDWSPDWKVAKEGHSHRTYVGAWIHRKYWEWTHWNIRMNDVTQVRIVSYES